MKPINLCKLPLVALIGNVGVVQAFDGPDTDYTNDPQSRHVWNESLEPIELVNSILCFTKQMRGTEFINDGPYRVLADEAACFDNDQDQSPAGASANNPEYMEVIVDIEQQTDDSPLQVSAWMPDMGDEDEQQQAIKFKAEIVEGVSDENPFGQFTFNFDFFANIDDVARLGGGEVKTINDLDGRIGFTLYESAGTDSQSASVVMSEDRSEGVALTSSRWDGGFGRAYGLAFNDSHVLVQSANSYEELGYRNGDDSGTCLSRTEFEDAVWRYDLYDAETGDRVDVNAGFSFRYDSDGDDLDDSHGHVGYWGLWAEDPQAIENGDTIRFEDPVNDQVTEYTVVRAPGRLIKHTVETLSFNEASGIVFNRWDDSAIAEGYDQWLVRYLTVNGDNVELDGFYRVAGANYTEGGTELEELEVPSRIVLGDFETLYLYSEQLGGEVKYLQGDDNLTYYRQEFINGSETGPNDVLADGSLSLVCVDRCLKGTLEAADLQQFDGPNSPFVWDPNLDFGPFEYSFFSDGDMPLTLIRVENGEAVRYDPSLTEESLGDSPHSWGVRSGPMVTPEVAETFSNPWDIYNDEFVTEFYVWETGPNEWNQLTAVRDVTDAIAEFDKPIQFSYHHSDANDRSGSAGEHDGQVFMINYGGNGDMWGIPQEEFSEDRWVPVFNIADGVLLGPDDSYVIKAREIEQTMSPADGECSGLTISDPAVEVPTEVTGSADIGDMPVVDEAPSVIAGELQVAED